MKIKHGVLKGVYNGKKKLPADYVIWVRLRYKLKRGAFGGAKMCKRWDKYENFIEDMGKKPKGKYLARINPLKDFCKNNCYWGDRPSPKRFFDYYGTILTKEEVAKRIGITPTTLMTYIRKGWGLKRIEKHFKVVKIEDLDLPKDRDTAIVYAIRMGISPTVVAKYFNLTRNRVYQIRKKFNI